MKKHKNKKTEKFKPTMSIARQIAIEMRRRHRRKLKGTEIVDYGDSVAILIGYRDVYEQHAWANARGRTGLEAKKLFGQFYRDERRR